MDEYKKSRDISVDDFGGEVDLSDERQNKRQNRNISLQNRIYKQGQRKIWGNELLHLVKIGFAANMIFMTFAVIGVMNGYEIPYAMPSVIGSGIANVVGLAYLAVRYFFSDDPPAD